MKISNNHHKKIEKNVIQKSKPLEFFFELSKVDEFSQLSQSRYETTTPPRYEMVVFCQDIYFGVLRCSYVKSDINYVILVPKNSIHGLKNVISGQFSVHCRWNFRRNFFFEIKACLVCLTYLLVGRPGWLYRVGAILHHFHIYGMAVFLLKISQMVNSMHHQLCRTHLEQLQTHYYRSKSILYF